MLIENQNNLNKKDLESSSTQKFETVTQKSNKKHFSIHKTDEIKCFNRYETLYTDDNDDGSCNSHDSSTSSDCSTSSDEISKKISSGNVQKKEIEQYQRKGRKRKGRTRILSLKKRKQMRKSNY